MTKERGEEVVLAAVVLSTAIHVGLMLLVRPQVMTHVVSDAIRSVRHAPMSVPKAPPPPEMVEWAAVVGAVWRDVDDTRKAVFVANVSSERQTVRFRMPPGCGAPQVFPLPGEPSPDLAVADGVVTLTLAPTSFVGVTAPRR